MPNNKILLERMEKSIRALSDNVNACAIAVEHLSKIVDSAKIPNDAYPEEFEDFGITLEDVERFNVLPYKNNIRR